MYEPIENVKLTQTKHLVGLMWAVHTGPVWLGVQVYIVWGPGIIRNYHRLALTVASQKCVKLVYENQVGVTVLKLHNPLFLFVFVFNVFF